MTSSKAIEKPLFMQPPFNTQDFKIPLTTDKIVSPALSPVSEDQRFAFGLTQKPHLESIRTLIARSPSSSLVNSSRNSPVSREGGLSSPLGAIGDGVPRSAGATPVSQEMERHLSLELQMERLKLKDAQEGQHLASKRLAEYISIVHQAQEAAFCSEMEKRDLSRMLEDTRKASEQRDFERQALMKRTEQAEQQRDRAMHELSLLRRTATGSISSNSDLSSLEDWKVCVSLVCAVLSSPVIGSPPFAVVTNRILALLHLPAYRPTA